MSNPIDWGNTPMAVALVRGVIAAILTGALASVVALQQPGLDQNQAILMGVAAGIPSLLALLGYGASDQNRANNGVVIAADVPVQVEAAKSPQSATNIAEAETAKNR